MTSEWEQRQLDIKSGEAMDRRRRVIYVCSACGRYVGASWVCVEDRVYHPECFERFNVHSD
jgi:hypothetical protein